MKEDFTLLKHLFCIHSKSGKEGKIRKFIWNWIRQTVPDAKIVCDKPGNLYITKGKSETYPCIVAHMDQVQERHSKDFMAYEAEDIIIGFSPKRREQQGLGADDKCGLWIAMKCLQKFDCLKVAFFVGEEVGCKGSGQAEMEFFSDCRFVIEPDRKGSNDLITQIGWTSLCSDDFLKDIGYKKFGYKEADGMTTDIEALKDNGLMLSCVNVSCGYYEPHRDTEFVYKPALLNCLTFVEHIIKTCTKVYPHIDKTAQYERENYYFDISDDLYSEIYDLLTNNPNMSFGEIEAMFKDFYGSDKINKGDLETQYELAREDILFYNEEKERKTTKVLNKQQATMCKNNEIVATLPEGATPDERRAAFFEAAYSLNVNDKCEKKENLTYLTWAFAWAEFKKIYPSATYRIVKNPTTNLPYFEDPNTGLIVYTEVTAEGITHEMWLPVMNSANKSMKQQPYQYQVWNKQARQYETRTVEAATMFDINKTLMRCLVKNLAMFGLGLYIYAGEDLPEAENNGNSEESANTTVKMVEPKKTTTRKAKTVAAPQQPKQNTRFEGIKNAINSMQDTDSLLALYNEHKQEVEGNPEIKAMFTLRKYELQQAA